LLAAVLDGAIGQEVRKDIVPILGLLCAATFVLAVGLVDDILGLRARTKFIAQVAAAAALCALGVRIESLGAENLFRIEFGWLSWPLTILWIVGITNSVNLIDGLDGLAAGISAITCAVVAAFALQTQQVVMVVTMLAVLGGLTGFLFFNFSPAKVFLGDCGSLFVGFMLAGASVLCSTKTATTVGLALPLLAMGIPIFDTLFSMVRRALERRSLFAPDRRHIHHRLMNMGLRQRHIVLVLYAATALSAGLGMFMMIAGGAAALVIFLCVLLLLGLFLRSLGVFRLRGILEALRGIARRRREAKKDREIFEEAQLRLRDVRDVREWWRVIAGTAEKMGAVRLTIIRCDGPRVKRTNLSPRSEYPSGGGRTVRLAIPLAKRGAGSLLRAEMDVCTWDSLEEFGRRLALFGRLIDESIDLIAQAEGERNTQSRRGDKQLDRQVA